MTLSSIQYRLRVTGLWSWGLMAFCLPFSTALTLFFSAFGLLFGLLGFDWSSFKQAMRHPISILCVALFIWLALSIFWSIAPPDELMEGVSKYRKLLYVPLVGMLVISIRAKPWFLMNFFTAGCLLVCVGSLSSSSGLLEQLIGPQLPGGGWGLGGSVAKHWFYIGPPEAPTFGRAWIAQGAFLAFAALYLIASIFVWVETPSLLRKPVWGGSLILALFLLITVTINLGGRTGYVLLIVGLFLWFLKLIQQGNKRRSIYFFLSVLVSIPIWVSYQPRSMDRINDLISGVSAYRDSGAETSQGLRLRFWEAGVRAALDRPMTGWGVGAYPEVFSRDLNQPPHLRASRPHPHSEYVLQFLMGGLPGLAIFFSIVILLLYRFLSSKNHACPRTLSLGLLGIVFFADAAVNSAVWDLAEGHFLLIFAVGVITAELGKSGLPASNAVKRAMA
ncbi:MAG: O-antigen ligase domain-containing protein [Proteobacteria bacterium]|nr:O-antigen ligase domain-containing protein [Pseudomonadota bacterium]